MTHFCDSCERSFTNQVCPRCGAKPAKAQPTPDTEPVSVADDSLDTMIEQASRPTLAALLTRGINSGLIKPTHEYSNGAPTT
jgi:hypothetical protein